MFRTAQGSPSGRMSSRRVPLRRDYRQPGSRDESRLLRRIIPQACVSLNFSITGQSIRIMTKIRVIAASASRICRPSFLCWSRPGPPGRPSPMPGPAVSRESLYPGSATPFCVFKMRRSGLRAPYNPVDSAGLHGYSDKGIERTPDRETAGRPPFRVQPGRRS